MGRWTQHDEESHRLPEGFVRVAYDADTVQHTYRDTKSGKLYRSAPGERYGTLHPVSDHLPSRPNAFAPEGSHHSRSHSRSPSTGQKSTFHDILPAHAITTSPTSTSPPSSIGPRFLASAGIHLRSQSMRIPSSSSKKPLHSRSKSVLHRPPEHDHRPGHPHHHDPQAHPRHLHDVPSSSRHAHHSSSLPSNKGTKPGFSLSSAFQSLSRSLTTARARTRQENSTQDRPDHDRSRGYRRL